jgi:hypothetical protein
MATTKKSTERMRAFMLYDIEDYPHDKPVRLAEPPRFEDVEITSIPTAMGDGPGGEGEVWIRYHATKRREKLWDACRVLHLPTPTNLRHRAAWEKLQTRVVAIQAQQDKIHRRMTHFIPRHTTT